MKIRGFTLIEMLVVLMIFVGIIVATIPYSSHFSNKNLILVRKDQILNAIKYSRNQAIILDSPVVLSKLPDKGDWSNGMFLFVDENEDHHYSTGEKIIHEWRWNDINLNVLWDGFRSDHYIVFHNDPSQSIASGSFIISRTGHSQVIKLIINRFGRARMA